MEQREQFMSGIATIALAVLFPIYWIMNLSQSQGSFGASIEANLLSLDLSDLLFLIIGILEVYIYLSLLKTLKDYTGTAATQLLLMLMCATVIVFHSTLIFDFYFATVQVHAPQMVDSLNLIATVISIGGLVVYSIIGLVFSVLLMMKANEISALIKVFSVLLLLTCALQITVIFSFVSILLFPAALLVLAIHFLKSPSSVEVV